MVINGGAACHSKSQVDEWEPLNYERGVRFGHAAKTKQQSGLTKKFRFQYGTARVTEPN